MNPDTADASLGSSVEDDVRNLGPGAAGPSTTRYYLGTSQRTIAGAVLLAGVRSAPGLAAQGRASRSKATVTLTIPLATPRGKYFVWACAEDLHAVAEQDELNNCDASHQLKVQ